MKPQAGFTPHVTTLGQGPRRALALHCSLAHGGAWSGLAKYLGADLTFVAPDMPSHGRSADWDEMSHFADTVFRSAVETLDAAPMDIVGHSFGAVVALRLAVTHPTRVRSLTLIESVFFAVAQQDAPDAMIEHYADFEPFVEAVRAGNRIEATRVFNRIWGDGSKWDDIPERSRNAMIRAIPMIPATYDFLYEDDAGMLAPGVLDKATMPTLLVRGFTSAEAITAIADGLVARLPDATQSVIDGAGHMAPISHPVLVADAMRGLLKRS